MICISGSTSKVIMNNQKIQMVVKMINKTWRVDLQFHLPYFQIDNRKNVSLEGILPNLKHVGLFCVMT